MSDQQRFAGEALAFADVLFKPVTGSKVLPAGVDLSVQLTPGIRLNAPLLSAAMDTVTESDMAIALARQGGIGVVHRNLTIADQAAEVEMVKRSQSGMISRPITVSPDMTLAQVEELNVRYRSAGFPVVDKKGRLVGLIANRDKRRKHPETKVRDAMKPVRKLRTMPPGTTIEEAMEFFGTPPYYEKLPLVDNNRCLVGFYTWKDVEKREKYPSACLDRQNRLVVAAAIGTAGDDFLPRAEALVAAEVDLIVIDTKNGHYQFSLDALTTLRERFPDLGIIPANVVTAEGVREVAKRGASAAKLGLGVGSICTSTDVTGVGSPQAEAVIACAEAARECSLPLIVDGGLTSSADVLKALALGGTAVMSGRLFAGTDETPTEPLAEDQTLVPYRGMGSRGAMSRRLGSRYVQERVAEGVEGAVPRLGPVAEVIKDLLTGVRTGMSELGAARIEDLWALSYYQYTGAGAREAHPHDIILVEETRRRRSPQ